MLYLSLLGEFRSTVTPVVIEMIKLVQGKEVVLFILRTVLTEYIFIIILHNLKTVLPSLESGSLKHIY